MIYIRDKWYLFFLLLLSCYLLYRLNNDMLYYYVDHIMIYVLLLLCHVRIFCSSLFRMSLSRLSCHKPLCKLDYRYVLVDGNLEGVYVCCVSDSDEYYELDYALCGLSLSDGVNVLHSFIINHQTVGSLLDTMHSNEYRSCYYYNSGRYLLGIFSFLIIFLFIFFDMLYNIGITI